MGENSSEIADHDRRVRAKSWRRYAANWMTNGTYTHEMIKFIAENQLTDTTMCIAGTFDGGIYLPFALYAQMFRKNEDTYAPVLNSVAKRACITVD